MVLQYEPVDQTRRVLPAERLAGRAQPQEEGVRLSRRPDQKTVGDRQRTLRRDHAPRTVDLHDLRPAGRHLFLLSSRKYFVMVWWIYGRNVSGLGLRPLR